MVGSIGATMQNFSFLFKVVQYYSSWAAGQGGNLTFFFFIERTQITTDVPMVPPLKKFSQVLLLNTIASLLDKVRILIGICYTSQIEYWGSKFSLSEINLIVGWFGIETNFRNT